MPRASATLHCIERGTCLVQAQYLPYDHLKSRSLLLPTRRPCHYLAVDRQRRILVLAVRGSLQLGDIATDLDASPLRYKLGGREVGCCCCEGSRKQHVASNAHCIGVPASDPRSCSCVNSCKRR